MRDHIGKRRGHLIASHGEGFRAGVSGRCAGRIRQRRGEKLPDLEIAELRDKGRIVLTK